MSQRCRCVVLLSGSGSNLQAFIDQAEQGVLPIDLVAVISNRPGVRGLERAAAAGIETVTLDHTVYADRQQFDAALRETVQSYQPDLVILAGFMRILTGEFVQAFSGRLLNIHPSLLPKYPGLHTHQRALEAGDSHAGATVHFVTEELDGGPAILQARVAIEAGDDAATLAQRVLIQEHRIYPQVVRWFADGRLTLSDNRAILDGQALPAHGVDFATLA